MKGKTSFRVAGAYVFCMERRFDTGSAFRGQPSRMRLLVIPLESEQWMNLVCGEQIAFGIR